MGFEKSSAETATQNAVLWAVAIIPLLLAATGFPLVFGADDRFYFFRHFSLPVTWMELLIALGIRLKGISILDQVTSAPVWMRIALGTLLAVVFGGYAFVVVDRFEAAIRIFGWLVHLLFGLSIFALYAGKANPNRTNQWWVILIGLAGFLGLLIAYTISVPEPTKFNWMGLGFGVVNTRQLHEFIAPAFAIAIALTFLAEDRRVMALSFVLATFAASMSFWSGGRAAVLGCLVAGVTGLALCEKARTIRCAGLFLTSLLIGILASAFWPLPPSDLYGIERIVGSAQQSSTVGELSSGRLSIWSAAVDAILERPFFGYGESQFDMIAIASIDVRFTHPHNAILQMVFSWGLVGATCFFGLIGFLALRLLSRLKACPDAVLPSIMVIASISIMSLLDGAMYDTYPVMVATFALAFGLAASSPPKGPIAVEHKAEPRRNEDHGHN